MIDVDMVNAHHQFFVQICEACGEPCPNLKSYVEDREKWRNLVIDTYLKNSKDGIKKKKEIAKNLFIRMMYGGGFNKWLEAWGLDKGFLPTPEISSFTNELKRLQKWVAGNNPEIVDIVVKTEIERKKRWEELSPEEQIKKPYIPKNVYSSTTAFYLQEIEVRILECCYTYCVNNGYIVNNVGVLCADGLMILKDLFKPTLMTELQDEVKRCMDLVVKFETKDMDEAFTNIDKHLKYDINTQTGNIADYFYMMNGDYWLFSNSQLYNYNGTYWEQDDKEKNRLITFIDTTFAKQVVFYFIPKIQALEDKIKELLISKDSKKKYTKELIKQYEDEISDIKKTRNSIVNICRSSAPRTSLIKDICAKVCNNCVKFNRNPYLFAFNNKIFDLKKNDFVKPDREQYISTTCGYNHTKVPKYKIDKMWTVINQIYPDKEIRDYCLVVFATGLCGVQLQHFFIDTGEGSNGKSFINELMLATCGAYGYKLTNSILFSELKEGANPQTANLDGKRFVYCEEPSSKKRLCSGLIKELTGSTELNARGLYSSDCDKTLCLTFKMGCNSIPKFDEVNNAVIRRIKVSPYESRFIPKQDYINLPENERRNIYTINPELGEGNFKDEYKLVFFEILRDYFLRYVKNGLPEPPTKSKKITADLMATSDDLYWWFKGKFVRSDEDYITFDDVYKRFSISPYYDNMTKQDKRLMNKNKLFDLLKDNTHLKSFVGYRDSYFNKIKMNFRYIKGWKERENEDENEEEQEDDDDGVEETKN